MPKSELTRLRELVKELKEKLATAENDLFKMVDVGNGLRDELKGCRTAHKERSLEIAGLRANEVYLKEDKRKAEEALSHAEKVIEGLKDQIEQRRKYYEEQLKEAQSQASPKWEWTSFLPGVIVGGFIIFLAAAFNDWNSKPKPIITEGKVSYRNENHSDGTIHEYDFNTQTMKTYDDPELMEKKIADCQSDYRSQRTDILNLKQALKVCDERENRKDGIEELK